MDHTVRLSVAGASVGVGSPEAGVVEWVTDYVSPWWHVAPAPPGTAGAGDGPEVRARLGGYRELAGRIGWGWGRVAYPRATTFYDGLPDGSVVAVTPARTTGIARGRFVDRDYGVLGYEWLHMLTVLAGVLPEPLTDAYLATDPATSQLWATHHPELFLTDLTEHTVLDRPDGPGLHVELVSSVTGPHPLLGPPPAAGPAWQRDLRPGDTRHRHVAVHAGRTTFVLHLEPVTTHDGWQLDRDQHRLTATRDGQLLHDSVLHDAPMRTAIAHAVDTLLGATHRPGPDLAPLRRTAALATLLRDQSPE